MKNCKNKILCSTGTMVGSDNGYNYRHAVDEISRLKDIGLVYGGELMMLPFYYDKEKAVTDSVLSSGIPYPVTHCEKQIGTDLSRAAFLFADGRPEEAEELTLKNLEFFEINCRFAHTVGSEALVVHLWGGRESDGHVEYNCAALPRLFDAAKKYGLDLLVENVPSSCADPLSNWRKVISAMPEVSLIFDSRFATLHNQVKETLTDRTITNKLRHVHVSDFVGGYRRFENLRPILHPGEGVVDFKLIGECLGAIGYTGTVTLESPVMSGGGLDSVRLEDSLKFIRKLLS